MAFLKTIEFLVKNAVVSKEIIYADEAATFFYNLMLGMAHLSPTIQSHTFDQHALQTTIENSSMKLFCLAIIGLRSHK